MTELHLLLHGCRFSLRGPAAALRPAACLYHPSLLEHTPHPATDPTARFELVRREAHWRLIEEGAPEPLGDFDEAVYALLRWEHAVEGHLLSRLDPGLAFHAGAVVIDGGACLLAGTADAGKSSSTLQLVELGHAFLAEEIAAIGTDGRVHPHLQSLSLDPRVVAELARGHRLSRGRLDALDDLLHRYTPSRVATVPAPVETIVLPSFRPGEPPCIEELRPESALTELLGYCFEPRGDHEAAMNTVIALSSGARLLRVGYPDAASARQLWLELFGAGPS